MNKILILHHCGDIGGAGLSAYWTSKMLQPGYDVVVACPSNPPDMHDYMDCRGIPVITYETALGCVPSYSGGASIYQRTFWKNVIKIPHSVKYLNGLIKSVKPDIVAVNSMVLSWAGRHIQGSGVKSVCFVRETPSKGIGFDYIKHQLNNYFDGVIFISRFDMDCFKCRAPVTGVVNDCVSAEDFSVDATREEAGIKLGINPSAFNVLFVGGTSRLKGWDVICNAMGKLKNDNINLIVTGYEGDTMDICADNIKYIGVRKDMPLVYRACDILVFPSTAPHQARPVFEAGMMHIPVIISDFEQTGEHIRHMENGITFKPSAYEELAQAIRLLAYDKELCTKLGECNYKYAMKNHEFHENRGRLLELIGRMEIS